MRSIDNMREWANGLHGVYINQVDHTITVTTGWDAPPDMDSVSLRDHVNGILDAIEREYDQLVMKLNAEHLVRQNVERENERLRELVRDVVLLAGLNGCDVTKMQMHAHGGDWRTIWERMAELRVPGTEADHD